MKLKSSVNAKIIIFEVFKNRGDDYIKISDSQRGKNDITALF